LSVAFTKEDSAETASELVLPDRPISTALNLVTQDGLDALRQQLVAARDAYEAAQMLTDLNERRRQSAVPLRDLRYFSERVRTAQLVLESETGTVVTFGCVVTFRRSDGRSQTFRLVGEDEADPKAGTLSYVSPVGKELMGREAGETIRIASQEATIVSIR
jgi:transcription elongation GreA/GreB family factor